MFSPGFNFLPCSGKDEGYLTDVDSVSDDESATDVESAVGDEPVAGVKNSAGHNFKALALQGAVKHLSYPRLSRSSLPLLEPLRSSQGLQSPFVPLAVCWRKIANAIALKSSVDETGGDPIADSEEEGSDDFEEVLVEATLRVDDVESPSEGEGTDALEREVKRLLDELVPSPASSAPSTPKALNGQTSAAPFALAGDDAVYDPTETPSTPRTLLVLPARSSPIATAPDSGSPSAVIQVLKRGIMMNMNIIHPGLFPSIPSSPPAPEVSWSQTTPERLAAGFNSIDYTLAHIVMAKPMKVDKGKLKEGSPFKGDKVSPAPAPLQSSGRQNSSTPSPSRAMISVRLGIPAFEDNTTLVASSSRVVLPPPEKTRRKRSSSQSSLRVVGGKKSKGKGKQVEV